MSIRLLLPALEVRGISLPNTCLPLSGYISFPRQLTRDTGGILQDERHSYEKCQYEEFKRRVAKMDELRVEKGGRSGLN